jgi:hypothetical protein
MREVISQKLDAQSIHEILSYPKVSAVLKSTALSEKEAIAGWLILGFGILKKATYGYVGNVGIKLNIPNKYKNYVNVSKDLDIAVLDINSLENVEGIEKRKLFDRIKKRRVILSYMYERIYSPFDVYRVDISPFQIGDTEYREIDVFTPETGIGPIKIYKEDFENGKKVEYFTSLNINTIIASQINPLGYDNERIKRVFFASISDQHPFDIEYIKQKLEGSIDSIKKVGISLIEYKNGFVRVQKICNYVKKRFENRVGGERNLENFNSLINLLEKMYEITPAV